MTWHFVTTEVEITDHGKTFTIPYDAAIVSDALLEPLRAWYLANRKIRIVTVKPAGKVTFDLPGMVCTDRPWSEIAVDDMVLDVPCEDVDSIMRKLQSAPTEDIGAPMYSLGGFLRFLVMSPDERDRIVAALSAVRDDAEVRAVEFWKNRESPAELLRMANARALGIHEDELPEIGGRDMSEFKS